MNLRRLVRLASWWAEDYAYALVWQTRGILAGKPNAYLSGELRPVVILPGIWETWTFLVPVIKAIHVAGHPVHVLTGLGRNNKSVIVTADAVAEFLRENDLLDVVFVAHSKGGLIGKYLMTYLDPEARVTAMVAVASPFSGSRYARYLLLPSLRAFSPKDPTTVLLEHDIRVNARIVSIFGEFDPHIPEGSRLTGAKNIELPIGGHFRIMGDAHAQSAILNAVEWEPPRAPRDV